MALSGAFLIGKSMIEIKEMTFKELGPYLELHSNNVFAENQDFHIQDILDEEGNDKIKTLRERNKNSVQLAVAAFVDNEFAGWSFGFQTSHLDFYMCNSAVLENFRRKGLYTLMMRKIMELATAEGFTRLYSRHNATNNPVIIPKLKEGFVISAMELNDNFGTLVHLSWHPRQESRKIMKYRSGEIKYDEDIKKWIP